MKKKITMWRLITATTQAPSPPPPHGIIAHARGGQLTYVPLFQPSARQPKYMYSTFLLLFLFGRYHVCLCHNYHVVSHYLEAFEICRDCLLIRLTKSVLFSHRQFQPFRDSGLRHPPDPLLGNPERRGNP